MDAILISGPIPYDSPPHADTLLNIPQKAVLPAHDYRAWPYLKYLRLRFWGSWRERSVGWVLWKANAEMELGAQKCHWSSTWEKMGPSCRESQAIATVRLWGRWMCATSHKFTLPSSFREDRHSYSFLLTERNLKKNLLLPRGKKKRWKAKVTSCIAFAVRWALIEAAHILAARLVLPSCFPRTNTQHVSIKLPEHDGVLFLHFMPFQLRKVFIGTLCFWIMGKSVYWSLFQSSGEFWSKNCPSNEYCVCLGPSSSFLKRDLKRTSLNLSQTGYGKRRGKDFY